MSHCCLIFSFYSFQVFTKHKMFPMFGQDVLYSSLPKYKININKPCNMTYQGTVDRAPSLPSMPCQNHREADGDRPMNAGSSYSLGTKKNGLVRTQTIKIGIVSCSKNKLGIVSCSSNQKSDCFVLKKQTWHSKLGLSRVQAPLIEQNRNCFVLYSSKIGIVS